MPTDSNARDALRSQSDSQKEPEGGELQSGKTPQAKVSAGGQAVSIEPDDAARALLAELTVGSVVDSKYRIDAVLGRGAMGVVVAATHEQLGERVALKFLRYTPKVDGIDDFQTRFKREARVSARLKNEHITRVIDVGVWRAHVPYMVMDYLTGTDLRQLIRGGGPLPVGTALDYAVQVCEGIAEAHAQGIVHRDLKPSNLFITKRPDGADLLKILDFGISKWTAGEAEIDELTQTGVVLGSPKYMAPEQLFGSSEVDSRADVWSIGAILYEMLSGRPPFDLPTFTKICAELSTDRLPPSLVARRSEITPELEAVVMKCFARTPDHRMQNVAELAGALLDAVQAPFADAVRARIAFTLEPRTSKDGLSTSSGGMLGTTGSFGALLSQSGSRTAIPVTSPVPPASEATASPTSLPRIAVAPEPRRWGLWVGLVGVLLLGGVGYFALVGRGGEPAAPGSSTAQAPPPLQTIPTPAVATTHATTATTAPGTAGTESASASASAAPLPSARTVPALNRGTWRPPNVRPGPAATTAVQPTAAPPPATTAAPVATTPPPATTKADPLGDRQ